MKLEKFCTVSVSYKLKMKKEEEKGEEEEEEKKDGGRERTDRGRKGEKRQRSLEL